MTDQQDGFTFRFPKEVYDRLDQTVNRHTGKSFMTCVAEDPHKALFMLRAFAKIVATTGSKVEVNGEELANASVEGESFMRGLAAYLVDTSTKVAANTSSVDVEIRVLRKPKLMEKLVGKTSPDDLIVCFTVASPTTPGTNINSEKV